MNRAVFLDRDGVLIKTNVINGKPYAIRTLSELQIFSEALFQLNRLKQIKFLLIVVTNQPDVKKGLSSIEIQKLINNQLIESLPIDLIKICGHYVLSDPKFLDIKPNIDNIIKNNIKQKLHELYG